MRVARVFDGSGEVTFTDNDVKILKAWTGNVDALAFDALPQGKLKALLSRLEAAERVCEHIEFYWPKGEANLERDLLLWRKAAGK